MRKRARGSFQHETSLGVGFDVKTNLGGGRRSVCALRRLSAQSLSFMSRRLPAAAGAPPRRLCVLPATTAEPWWCILSLRRLSNCRRTDVCRPDAAQSCRTDCSHVFTSRHTGESIRALMITIPAREQLTRRLTLVAVCSSATCLRQERMSKQVVALGQGVSCTSYV